MADVQDPVGLRREACPHLQGGQGTPLSFGRRLSPLPNSGGTDRSPLRSHEAPRARRVPSGSCVHPQPRHAPARSLAQQCCPRRDLLGRGTRSHLPTRDCQVPLQQSHGVGRHHVALRLVVLPCGQRVLRAAAPAKPSQAQQPAGSDVGPGWSPTVRRAGAGHRAGGAAPHTAAAPHTHLACGT